jgi:hypothetical protein
MSLHHNTKTPKSGTPVPQPAQRAIVVLPTQERSLFDTLKAANYSVNPDTIMDILYESVYQRSIPELRYMLGMSGDKPIRQALRATSGVGFNLVLAAEEALRLSVEHMITFYGGASLGELYAEAVKIADKFGTLSNDASRFLCMDFATGRRFDPPIEQEDEDE